jgi:hypothetical protein
LMCLMIKTKPGLSMLGNAEIHKTKEKKEVLFELMMRKIILSSVRLYKIKRCSLPSKTNLLIRLDHYLKMTTQFFKLMESVRLPHQKMLLLTIKI